MCWSHEGNLSQVVARLGRLLSVAATGPAGQEPLLASYCSPFNAFSKTSTVFVCQYFSQRVNITSQRGFQSCTFLGGFSRQRSVEERWALERMTMWLWNERASSTLSLEMPARRRQRRRTPVSRRRNKSSMPSGVRTTPLKICQIDLDQKEEVHHLCARNL